MGQANNNGVSPNKKVNKAKQLTHVSKNIDSKIPYFDPTIKTRFL
jgi:hypothetical protein